MLIFRSTACILEQCLAARLLFCHCCTNGDYASGYIFQADNSLPQSTDC